MPAAAAIPGIISGVGSVINGINTGNAAKSAASAEVTQDQAAIKNWQDANSQQQGNQQPFINAGQSSLGMLMSGLQNGTFGPGSLPNVPTGPGAFTAPTLADARNTPGYQFTQEQGNKGILEGAAAAGGSISGGTLKSLDSYNSGLADTTYNDVFNRSLQTYQSGLQGYQANLQGYYANLAGQQQGFQQLTAPIGIGETAASNLNSNLGQGATNVSDLMQGIGTAQAGGILGKAQGNASALSGALSGIGGLMGKIPFGGGPSLGQVNSTVTGALNNTLYNPYSPINRPQFSLPG